MKPLSVIRLGDIMAERTTSVDPSRFPEETFDLYSIPAFDSGKPEVLQGCAIGSSKLAVQPGDILLSRIVPHIRRAWVVGKYRGRRMIASGEWITLRSPMAHPNYLRHLLISDPFHAMFMNTVAGVGGSLLRARPAHVARIPIRLPEYPEQCRIADVLDRAEALRAKRRAALAEVEALTLSVYFDLFGDPVTNPRGLPKRALGQLIRVKSGDSILTSELSQKGECPVYGGNGIAGFHTKCMFEEPVIVIGRVGAYCGVVHITKPNAWVTDNALFVVPTVPGLETAYLARALSIADLNQYAGRAAQPLVSGSRIYPVEILVPPVQEQREFSRRIAAVEKLKAAHRASLAELDALFASLQHRAFRGEL